MPNPGPSVEGTPNTMQESIVAGSNVVYTFANLPPATNFNPGFVAITSDEGLCVVSANHTWQIVGGGVEIAVAGTTASSGTVLFSNANGVTFGMNAQGVITATVTPGAAAGIGAIQLPNATYTSGTASFVNANNISFGSSGANGISASFNSTVLAGTGTTYGGTNASASMTLNSNGLALSLSVPTNTGVGISAAGGSQSAGDIVFSNSNGVSFGMNGSTVTASVAAGAGGGIAATIGGNTAGAGALISSGTLFLAGGNNVTLSQNGQSVTISANTAAAANLSVSAGTTTGAFGGVTFSNSNNLSFGLNNGTITGSVNAPGLGTTFAGANLSGSMTLNSAGLNLSLSSPLESGIGLSAAGSSQTAGNLVLSNSNGLSFGMNGSTITGSYNSTQFAGLGTTFSGTNVSGSMTLNSAGLNLALSGAAGGAGASTGGVYAAGNTTGQSSSSTFAQSSLNISAAGIISAGWSSNTFIISAPGTTGLTQLSAGMSALGNTVGTTGLASAQLVLAGGNNVTLSGSTNGGSMTISISAGTVAGQTLNVSAGTTSGNLGSIVFSNSNGVSFGLNGSTITASAAGGGGATTGGYFATGNTTQSSSGTYANSSQLFNFAGGVSGGFTNGSIQISGPATSSISGTGLVSVSVNGSTISIGANALSAYAVSNTTQSTSGTVNGTALSFAGAGGVSVGVTNGSVVISGGAGGGGSVNFSAGTTSSNLGSVVFSNSNGVSFGLNGSTITGSANGVSTVGLYALGNTTQNSSTTLNQSALSFNGLGGITVGYSNGSVQLSGPGSAATTAAYYFLGNTTGQSSSSTGQDQTLSINANGGLSAGWTNGSIVFSAPPISSLSATGLASISINGSTISIGAAIPQLSFFQPLGPVQSTTVTQNGLGSVQVYPAVGAFPFSASRADMMASVSLSALVLSTQAQTLSMYVGLYSLNGSTLSLASSGSQSYAWTNNSNNSSASLSGMRRFSAPINVNYTGGFDLFVGVMSNTTFANSNAISLSNVVVPLGPGPQLQGLIGQTQVNSMQFVPGQGFFSATSAALPASIGLSQIVGAGSGGNAVDYYAPVQFVNVTA